MDLDKTEALCIDKGLSEKTLETMTDVSRISLR